MTRSDHADAADLLPLERPGGRVIRLATLVADVARAVDPSLPRGRDGSTLVQIDCDVDASIVVPGHASRASRRRPTVRASRSPRRLLSSISSAARSTRPTVPTAGRRSRSASPTAVAGSPP